MNRPELLSRLALLAEAESTQTALFHQAAAATYGLGVSDMRALSIVLRQGPQTAGALMRHLHVTSGAVTGVIDRLEKAGFANRTADPTDRRRVVVEVNPSRIAEANSAYARIGVAFEGLYASYTDEQLEFLAQYLHDATEITQNETTHLSPA